MTTHTPVQAKQQAEGNRTEQSAHPQSTQQGVGLNADFMALQRSAGNSAVNNMIPSLGGGSPLPIRLRGEMEQRFGEDFNNVRMHTDARAAQSADELSAKAYTYGNNIVFNEGRFVPEAIEGKRLLAHELAHVVQQSRGGAAPTFDSGAPHEIAARSAADAVSSGKSSVTVVGATGMGLAREEEDPINTVGKAQRKIAVASKQLAELKELKKTVEQTGGNIKTENTVIAYDAIQSAVWNARLSKDRNYQKQAQELVNQYDKLVKGNMIVPSNQPINTTKNSTEGFLLNSYQRGFDYVGELRWAMVHGPAEIDRLTSKHDELTKQIKEASNKPNSKELFDKLSGERKEVLTKMWEIQKLIKRAPSHLQLLSAPTLLDQDRINEKRDELLKKLKAPGLNPLKKARLEESLSRLQALENDPERINAVNLAKANPNPKDPAPLAAYDGVLLGSPMQTFVTIVVKTVDGETLIFQAKNIPGGDHAEDVFIGQIEKLIERNELSKEKDLAGAKVTIFGDQEVCKRCAERATKWEEKFGFKIGGYTTHAPALKNNGQIDEGEIVRAKGSMVNISNPADVKKREGARGIKYEQRQTFPKPAPVLVGNSETGWYAEASAPPAKPPVVRKKASAPKATVVPKQSAPAAQTAAASHQPTLAPPAKPPVVRKKPPVAQTAASPQQPTSASPAKPPVVPKKKVSAPKATVAPKQPTPAPPAKPPVVRKKSPVAQTAAGSHQPAPAPQTKNPAMAIPNQKEVVAKPAQPTEQVAAPEKPADKSLGERKEEVKKSETTKPETAKQESPKQLPVKVTSGLNKADTVLSAVLDYRGRKKEYLEEGFSEFEASAMAAANAGVILGANLKGGPIAAAVNAVNTFENAKNSAQGNIEALGTTIGAAGGGLIASGIAPTGPVGAAAQLLNTTTKVVGAPQEMQDTTSIAAELVPASILSTSTIVAMRTVTNLTTGDTAALIRQADQMSQGRMGTWVQGYSQLAAIVADMASGDSAQKALETAAKAGKGSVADRIGSGLADAMYELSQDEDAKSGKHGVQVQQLAQMLDALGRISAGADVSDAVGKVYKKDIEKAKQLWRDLVGG